MTLGLKSAILNFAHIRIILVHFIRIKCGTFRAANSKDIYFPFNQLKCAGKYFFGGIVFLQTRS